MQGVLLVDAHIVIPYPALVPLTPYPRHWPMTNDAGHMAPTACCGLKCCGEVGH